MYKNRVPPKMGIDKHNIVGGELRVEKVSEALKVKWFHRILAFSFIGGAAGFISIGIDIYNMPLKKSSTLHKSQETLLATPEKSIHIQADSTTRDTSSKLP